MQSGTIYRRRSVTRVHSTPRRTASKIQPAKPRPPVLHPFIDPETLDDVYCLAADGICLDLDGAIWAAFPLAHEFRRIAPGGEVLDRISMGDRLAIACTLGGPELRTLFLLTSLALPGDAIRGTRSATVHVVDVNVPGTGSP